MKKQHKNKIKWLLIQAVVLLHGAAGEPLEEELADEITMCLEEASKLCEV